MHYRAIACTLAAAMSAACRKPSPPKQEPAVIASARPSFRTSDAKGDVVAVSTDGSLVLTRGTNALTVWTSAGEKRTEIPTQVPAAEAKRSRYAISSNLVVEATDHELRAVAIASGTKVWALPLETVWGNLAFSRDGKRLALLLKGQVNLLDAATGREAVVIGTRPDDPTRLSGVLTLPRDVYFSADGARVGIRCGTNHANRANHTLFIADTATGAIVEQLVAPHVEGIADAVVLANATITIDDSGTVRRFERGALRATLEGGQRGRLGVTPDGNAIAIAGSKQVRIWSAGALVTSPASPDGDGWPSFVTPPDDKGVFVIGNDGKVVAVPRPTTAVAGATWRRFDDAEARAWSAVWTLADRGQDAAATEIPVLEAVAAREPVFAGALRFANQLAAGVPETFQITAPDQALGALALAEAYANSGYPDHGLFAFSGWLGEHLRTARPASEVTRAREVGNALVSWFDASDDREGAATISAWLYRAWPDAENVVEHYARALQDSNPKLAIQVIQKYLKGRRSEELEALLGEITP